MFVYDLIKIMYSERGFLPNFPYHLISDREMFNAFLYTEYNFFDFSYPNLLSETVLGDTPYNNLKKAIGYHVDKAIETADTDTPYIPPDWIISYMLGTPISVRSTQYDVSYLQRLFGLPYNNDVFDTLTSYNCYYESLRWLQKNTQKEYAEYKGETIDIRPPAVFGEPHVVKSGRIQESSPNPRPAVPDPFTPEEA